MKRSQPTVASAWTDLCILFFPPGGKIGRGRSGTNSRHDGVSTYQVWTVPLYRPASVHTLYTNAASRRLVIPVSVPRRLFGKGFKAMSSWPPSRKWPGAFYFPRSVVVHGRPQGSMFHEAGALDDSMWIGPYAFPDVLYRYLPDHLHR